VKNAMVVARGRSGWCVMSMRMRYIADLLKKWRMANTDHRSVLQGGSIESWFLQHL